MSFSDSDCWVFLVTVESIWADAAVSTFGIEGDGADVLFAGFEAGTGAAWWAVLTGAVEIAGALGVVVGAAWVAVFTGAVEVAWALGALVGEVVDDAVLVKGFYTGASVVWAAVVLPLVAPELNP